MRGAGRPVSLFDATSDNGTPYSADAARALAERVLGFVSAPSAMATVEAANTGFTEFADNAAAESSDTRYVTVAVSTAYGARSATVTTTRVDDASLAGAVADAEKLATSSRPCDTDLVVAPGPPGPINPALWHESALANLGPAHRVDVVRGMIARAASQGLMARGVVGVSARAIAVLTSDGHFEYGRTSTSTCSLTLRTASGSGSGWAAWKGEDWGLVDPAGLADRAAESARRARQLRAVEPGRYTVVLAPAALAELVGVITSIGAIDGRAAEDGRSVFARANGRTAVGEPVCDRRITMSADPMDPDGGFLPFAVSGRRIDQYGAVTWIRGGVLEQLSYDADTARARGRQPVANAGALRMSGGGASTDEMIASVERGIYVTRFSNVSIESTKTLAMSGVTRDGTFLIEGGKITSALRNLRFEDSPMRLLRSLGALGVAERVPVGVAPLVVPGAVVTDFLFSGVSDGS
jgi:predicted Zn-dependent protease